MIPVPEQYANKPNMWRVACELAKFKEPYKALDMLMALAGPMLKQEREQEGIGHE